MENFVKTTAIQFRWALIGYWITVKYRTRAGESGHYAAAKQLRKQGVPLSIARLILL